ncbi:MAG TPA: DUF2892 domain-containing protein [Acidobacteriaceae bacterium]
MIAPHQIYQAGSGQTEPARLLTVFVGLNLRQSAFTNWCPAMSIFRWMGLRDSAGSGSK